MEQRIIKFKAKRLGDGKWMEGDLYHNLRGFECCIGQQEKDDVYVYPVDPSSVCQFTWLKDEDGTEIWEHDILKNLPMTNEVIFRNGSFMIVEDYGDDIVEVPLSNMILGDGVCYLSVISNKFDRKEGEE